MLKFYGEYSICLFKKSDYDKTLQRKDKVINRVAWKRERFVVSCDCLIKFFLA